MVYGIPDFKFGKYQVARRVDQLRREGVLFRTGANVGVNLPFQDLRDNFDAVCLAIGAQLPREVPVPGRQLNGIYWAMDYLTKENRRQAGKNVEEMIDAHGKNVVVLGGGDTGADCVATAHRQSAKSGCADQHQSQGIGRTTRRQPVAGMADDLSGNLRN